MPRELNDLAILQTWSANFIELVLKTSPFEVPSFTAGIFAISGLCVTVCQYSFAEGAVNLSFTIDRIQQKTMQ